MSQLEISFPEPRARSTDPQTSKDAAKKIRAGSKRNRILSAMMLMPSGPKTTNTIAKFLGWHRDSVSPHMKPLESMGLVAREGTTYHDPTTDTKSECWKLTDLFRKSPIGTVYTKPTCCPTCRRPL